MKAYLSLQFVQPVGPGGPDGGYAAGGGRVADLQLRVVHHAQHRGHAAVQHG